MRRMLEALAGKPAPVRQCPMTAALVDPTMAQKEGELLLAFAAQVVGSRFPSPDQIADGLMDTSGTHTPVNSPARCSRARVTASRRFVLMRSPDRFGIRAGATSMQS